MVLGHCRAVFGAKLLALMLTIGCEGTDPNETSAGGGGTGLGPGGGGGGSGAVSCSPECVEQERCIEGQCQPLSELNVAVEWTVHYDFVHGTGGPTAPEFAGRAYATRWLPGSGPEYVVVAEAGECELIDARGFDRAWEWFTADAGTISVASASLGTIDLLPFDEHGRSQVELDGLVGGETVSISATGGADFHAFTNSVDVVEPIDLVQASPLTRGEPLVLSWGSPVENGRLRVAAFALVDSPADYGLSLLCDVADTGSLTIPGELTALLESDTSDTAAIQVVRSSSVRDQPSELPEDYVVSAWGAAYIFVEYLP